MDDVPATVLILRKGATDPAIHASYGEIDLACNCLVSIRFGLGSSKRIPIPRSRINAARGLCGEPNVQRLRPVRRDPHIAALKTSEASYLLSRRLRERPIEATLPFTDCSAIIDYSPHGEFS
jgi:hypothetical protein